MAFNWFESLGFCSPPSTKTQGLFLRGWAAWGVVALPVCRPGYRLAHRQTRGWFLEAGMLSANPLRSLTPPDTTAQSLSGPVRPNIGNVRLPSFPNVSTKLKTTPRRNWYMFIHKTDTNYEIWLGINIINNFFTVKINPRYQISNICFVIK